MQTAEQKQDNLQKVANFQEELEQLLAKYNADISLEDVGRNWMADPIMVVDFGYNENGAIPQLRLGRYLAGK